MKSLVLVLNFSINFVLRKSNIKNRDKRLSWYLALKVTHFRLQENLEKNELSYIGRKKLFCSCFI